MFAAASTLVLGVLLGASSGCGPERPPAPEAGGRDRAVGLPAAERGEAESLAWRPAETTYVLTHVDERGAFADAQAVDAVPERARGLVRVVWIDGPKPPPGQVWVTNLRAPEAPGEYRLQSVAREDFEELALGAGASSEVRVAVPEGLEPPPPRPAAAGKVIVYKTEWCGVCKSLLKWLDSRGVDYVAKDIEQDEAAVAELAVKAKAAGVKLGSVPMIDVDGELLVGFDREKLSTLLDDR